MGKLSTLILNEIAKDEKNKTETKLYHLSEREVGHMVPRIPKSDHEDQKTPRICFAKSIQGCLIGINENKDITDKVFHVYSLVTDNYYEPTIKEVADVKVTDEVWIKFECSPKYEYDIKVTEKNGTSKTEINGDTFDVPIWKYKVMKENEEVIIMGKLSTLILNETARGINGMRKIKRATPAGPLEPAIAIINGKNVHPTKQSEPPKSNVELKTAADMQEKIRLTKEHGKAMREARKLKKAEDAKKADAEHEEYIRLKVEKEIRDEQNTKNAEFEKLKADDAIIKAQEAQAKKEEDARNYKKIIQQNSTRDDKYRVDMATPKADETLPVPEIKKEQPRSSGLMGTGVRNLRF